MISFTYNDRNGTQSASYRGYTIRAVQDSDCRNPFEDFETLPLASYSDRSVTDYSDGVALAPFAGLPDSFFSRHWRKLAEIMELPSHDSDVRGDHKSYGNGTLAQFRRDAFEQALSEESSDLQKIADLWALRGVVAVRSTSRGYSQSDWADVLAVATPEWAATVGAPADSLESQCEGAIKLWSDWAWGNVYGFQIESPDGEELDSCWGFYGTDHDESGLADAAMESIDGYVRQASKARGDKLKELIRNHVPLALRPALLESASCAI